MTTAADTGLFYGLGAGDDEGRAMAYLEVRNALVRRGCRLRVLSDGGVVGSDLAPTEYVIEPVAGGLMIYLADVHGRRYWFGSPGAVAPVLKRLVSRSRRHPAPKGSKSPEGNE